MRNAIDQADPSVEVTLEGPGGKRKTIWMAPDTGATHSMVADTSLRDLGLTELTTTNVMGITRPLSVRVASLPRMFLGALTIERVPIAGGLTWPSDLLDMGFLGKSVLDRGPWEISWDRGTITLNATLWAAEKDVRTWPLVRERARYDWIEVRVNGCPVRMQLDTGSTSSRISKKLAARIGLRPHHVFTGKHTRADGEYPGGTVFVADLEIGPSKMEGQFFHEAELGEDARLGLAALTSYEVQIFPGSRLSFRPRNPDMRATAAARVRRWPWMPSCRSVGCVRGYVEGKGEGGRITFDFEESLPGTWGFLFGCADGTEPDWVIPPGLIATGGPPFRHVLLQLGQATARSDRAYYFSVPDIDKLLAPNGTACRQLTVLDVAPIPESEWPSQEGRVRLRR